MTSTNSAEKTIISQLLQWLQDNILLVFVICAAAVVLIAAIIVICVVMSKKKKHQTSSVACADIQPEDSERELYASTPDPMFKVTKNISYPASDKIIQ